MPQPRKIVLATSIAQTSLTIEGIRIVVDSGLARVPVYEPSTALTRLETRTISQASATQRQGRAGRTQAGVCYRLWPKGQDAARPAFDTPEILAADLTPLVLNLARWGVTDPAQMQFVDQPPASAWREAVALLIDLDALDETANITNHGEELAALPLHPRLAQMIQMGKALGATQRACDIAALLSEHGLGGDAVDIEERLQNFLTDRRPRAKEAKSLAKRWAKLVGDTQQKSNDVSVGRLIAFAYPDRVAQAARQVGRYRLANGRAANLPQTDRLAREPFLVVTDITGQAANGRIRAAASIDLEEIEDAFAGHIVEEQRVEFDTASRSVRARRVRALNQVVLADAPAKIDDPEEAAQQLCAGITELGVDILPWSKAQTALRGRVNYLHQTLGDPWPDLSDGALNADVACWLAPFIAGVAAISKIDAQMLEDALAVLLPWNLRHQMDQLLPTHFEAPTGSRVLINYAHETAPAIEIRVQELFGLTQHPAVADGQIPLLVILLSPAHRPIQMTKDLPGFWRGSWLDVAKDLKGRYPKHYWPDDPIAAAPTARAKPRS